MELNNFADFCRVLRRDGFSMGGGNSNGIYAIVPYSWETQDDIDSPVKWHTGDAETDPWEWRMRVLEECEDIAYSKFFFRTSGFITKEWYPYFYSVRCGGVKFDEAYEKGLISHEAKVIYNLIFENGSLPLHSIKYIGGFKKETSSKFDRALVELQMKMYITMCGRSKKVNKAGEGYGWNSTVFTTVEQFWKERNIQLPVVSEADAFKKIKKQVLSLNPNADEKKVGKFIKG